MTTHKVTIWMDKCSNKTVSQITTQPKGNDNMNMSLSDKARANRIAALSSLSNKATTAARNPVGFAAEATGRGQIWQKEIPVFRSHFAHAA